MNFNRIKIVLIIALSFALQACPSLVVKNIEKQESQIDSLVNNHKPNYLSKSISYEDYLLTNEKVTSNSIQDESDFDFQINVTNLDYSRFPNEILIDLVIADSNGTYLKNLAPPFRNDDYLKIWDRISDKCNTGSTIANLEIEEIQSDNSPKYAIAFVLDHSGSMGETKVNKLQSGVIELVQYLKAADMVSITKFTDEMYTSIELTEDKLMILDSFKVVGMKGIGSQGTAYFDAISHGIDQLNNAPDDFEKIVIAFTDGEDVSSDKNKEDVISELLTENIKLYNIGYGYADVNVLEELSEQSKGKFYMTISSREFPYVLRDIYLKLSNHYRITYTPSSCRDSHFVSIPVQLPNSNKSILGSAKYYIKPNPLEKVGDVVFLNIVFEVGKSSITDSESIDEVEKIANWMKNNPEHSILISGHTDNTGRKEFNKKLSIDRAISVRDLIVKSGVSINRIKTRGYGDTKPLVKNDSDENRRKNRRTEIVIIK